MVCLFLPKVGAGACGSTGRMFFLGAAFMLLETKAVVQLALLFGSTWIVNSMVFFTVLVLILLANLFVLKVAPTPLAWHYAGLFALLASRRRRAARTPSWAAARSCAYVAPCALALGPMFFAGVIFAKTFRDAADAGHGLRLEHRRLGARRARANPSRCCSASDTCCCWRSRSISCRRSLRLRPAFGQKAAARGDEGLGRRLQCLRGGG